MYHNAFDSPFAGSIYGQRYEHHEDKNWSGTTVRVVGSNTGKLYDAPKAQSNVGYISALQDRLGDLMGFRRFIPGGRYLYASGRDFNQVNNCLLLRCPDSREGFAMTTYQSEMALLSGAGIGVWYGDVRASGSPIRGTGGIAAGPVPKMQQINETGRYVIAGGDRRSAIWAGLPWWHKDIFEFITVKDWSDEVKALKAADWKFPAPMDMTNISVQLDDDFFRAHNHYTRNVLHIQGSYSAPDGGSWDAWAKRVYHTAVSHMLKHGEPGFSVDTGEHSDEVLRNACTEIVSADDSDVCNLGSLVLPRFSSPAEFGEAVRDATMFLTAGSMYSKVPYDKVESIRDQNRRLGLGLIGLHEFLMKKGVRYGTDDAFEVLDPYMAEYGRALEYANEQQHRLGISPSVAATALAPNGTIGIIAESTPSGDPLFSAAERRNVVVASPFGNTFQQHVVVDPTAARLVKEGVDPGDIEDAYSIPANRRMDQQVYIQKFTDQAISSTVNLPFVTTDPSEVADFKDEMLKRLPDLRGITVYPDGARSGQPRTPVDLAWALENEGTIFEGSEDTCVGGACGV